MEKLFAKSSVVPQRPRGEGIDDDKSETFYVGTIIGRHSRCIVGGVGVGGTCLGQSRLGLSVNSRTLAPEVIVR